jgi:threonine dehydrogenase-like Zn-dependent dehydrogenase
MKAARIVGPRQFEILNVDVPAPKPGEVLVRMEHLSICGSDLRTYDRVLPEEEYPLATGGPCHECYGVVEESFDDRIKKGQRVIALSGGLVEYAAVPVRDIVPVADNMDSELAVLCQPAGTVLYSCQQIGAILGQRVVVYGQGPIGLSFTDFLVRGGAEQVIVADRHDYRLEVAKRLGATHTVNAGREDVVEAVREITGGAMADVAIEACGRPEAYNNMFRSIRHQGLCIVFGLQHDIGAPLTLDWESMYERLPRVITTSSARVGERARTVASVVSLVSQGRLDLSHLLTHKMPFEQVGEAFDMYSNKKDNSLKILLNV